jgi:FkbM family methyltransferase
MDPSFLLSEWSYSLAHGNRTRDKARLASWSLATRLLGRLGRKLPSGSFSVQLAHDGVVLPLALRAEHVGVLMQVFHYGEYDAPDLDWARVETIVDAGANIGLSSRLFAHRSPRARILAVEPDDANLDLLNANLRPLVEAGRAEIIPKALWTESTFLDFTKNVGSVSHGLVDAQGATGAATTRVPTTTVVELLDRLGSPRIDILKMDIEGAEKEVLSSPSAATWLDRVDCLLVECHSHFGFGASPEFLRAALTPKGFSVRTYGPSEGLVVAQRSGN